MRKIIVATFLSMDGVMQGPGGPEEDTRNGFPYGGWIVPLGDELTGQAVLNIMAEPFDLLLGHFTYNIFAAYWPKKHDAIGEKFNSCHKYVAASTPVDLSWEKSTQLSDLPAELEKLKGQDGPNLLVHGSALLVQSLLQHRLVDELHTWVYPVTLGQGKRLFENSYGAQEWRVTGSVISTTGVIITTYVPNGDVRTGSFVEEEGR
jgi:dihydrofolate reductase